MHFYHANAELLAPRDLAVKLGKLVEDLAAERDAEADRARAEEDEVARLRAELDKLKGG